MDHRVDVEIRSIDVIDLISTKHFSLGKAPRTTHFTWRSLGIQIQSRPQTDLSHLCTLSTRTSYVRFFSLRKAVVQLNSAGDTRKAAPPSPSKVGPFQMSSCDKSTSMCKSFGARLDGARRGPCTIQARLGSAVGSAPLGSAVLGISPVASRYRDEWKALSLLSRRKVECCTLNPLHR